MTTTTSNHDWDALLNMLDIIRDFYNKPCDEGLNDARRSLLLHKHPQVADAIWLAQHNEATEDMLLALWDLYKDDATDTDDEFWEVRAVLAYLEDAPERIWLEAAADSNPEVQERVAINRHASPAAFEYLFEHGSEDIHIAMAQYVKEPAHLFQKLYDLNVIGVQRNLAFNINTPVDICRQLLDSDDPWLLRNLYYTLLRQNETDLYVAAHTRYQRILMEQATGRKRITGDG